jgi:hypothetical protein
VNSTQETRRGLKKRKIQSPSGFGPGWRFFAGLLISVFGTGFIAALSSEFAGFGSIASIAFILGSFIGLLFVSPVLVPIVIIKSFSPTALKTMGSAALCSLLFAVFDSVSYPSLSFFGGFTGLLLGGCWAWITEPSYAGAEDTETCDSCGYSLEGLPTESVCPECGRE